MAQFWWVNHNQTARQEIEGQYLWSPKAEANGARSVFYDNMRRAAPGDRVLSYAGQAVRFVGRAADYAFTAPKPEEFGSVGANWSRDGWLLPVFWTALDPPVSPKSMIARLGPMLPPKYSPIHTVSGAGNQKAYLAEVSPPVFEAVVHASHYDKVALAAGGANSLIYDVVKEVLDDTVQTRIEADRDLSSTVKRSLIDARRGQGAFRAAVEAREPACRLTGVTNPALLIASHIKPWRLCATAAERLDGRNGLLLTPDADHLFDRGFISFADDGEVLVSRRVDRDDLARLGFARLTHQRFGVFEAPAVWRTDTLAGSQAGYMAYHRSEVFAA